MGNTSSIKKNKKVDSSYEPYDEEKRKQEKIKINKVADCLTYGMPDKMNIPDHYIYEKNYKKKKYKKIKE